MKKIFEIDATLLAQNSIGSDCYHLFLSAPDIAKTAKPGQFINISCGEGYEPLLRRPLTIYKTCSETGVIEVVYKVRGKGTRMLSKKLKGETLEVLGPLGEGFVFNPKDKKVILASGGLGVASLMSIVQKLINKNKDYNNKPYLYALIGAHTEEELICIDEFTDLGENINVVTWIGREMLEESLQKIIKELAEQNVKPSDCSVYACGPEGMMKRMAAWAEENEMLCQVSLEAKMACGVGGCQSCICKVKASHKNKIEEKDYNYALVCREGPVFDAKEVQWND